MFLYVITWLPTSFAERVRAAINPFRVEGLLYALIPGLSLRSNPGLKLANAFGVVVPNSN